MGLLRLIYVFKRFRCSIRALLEGWKHSSRLVCLVAYQEMVHHTPKQKCIVVFCAEGVEPRLGEDEFFIIGSL